MAHSSMPPELWHYWADGEGRTRIPWGTSGDFYECKVTLGEYLRPDQLNGACEELHEHILGISTTEHAKQLKAKGQDHPHTTAEVHAARANGRL